MLTRASFGLVVLVLAAVAAALVIILYVVAPPTAKEMHAELMRRIEELMPKGASPCGLVPFQGESQLALDCVGAAVREKKAFWVASQIPFDDSDAWLVVLTRPEGTFESVLLDSSPTGEPIYTAQYHVLERASCSSLRMSPDEWPPIDCAGHRPNNSLERGRDP